MIEREGSDHDSTPATRQLQRDAKRFGVRVLFQRVASSEQYDGNPTRVRVEWAFADFLDALVMLDGFSAIAAEARRKAEEGRRG